MCAQRRASVHPVRARTPLFVCGGDDYLFILIVGSCKVSANTSPAAALAAAAAAICVPPLGMAARALLLTHGLRPCGPHRLWTAAACAELWAAGVARGKWQIQKWPFATFSAHCCFALVFVVFGLVSCVRERSLYCTVLLYWFVRHAHVMYCIVTVLHSVDCILLYYNFQYNYRYRTRNPSVSKIFFACGGLLTCTFILLSDIGYKCFTF